MLFWAEDSFVEEKLDIRVNYIMFWMLELILRSVIKARKQCSKVWDWVLVESAGNKNVKTHRKTRARTPSNLRTSAPRKRMFKESTNDLSKNIKNCPIGHDFLEGLGVPSVLKALMGLLGFEGDILSVK